MTPGDLVIHEYKNSVGILLEVRVDKKLMKNPFSFPCKPPRNRDTIEPCGLVTPLPGSSGLRWGCRVR